MTLLQPPPPHQLTHIPIPVIDNSRQKQQLHQGWLTQVDQILLPSAPALPGLLNLRLVGMRAMDAFPARIAGALKRLQCLDLAGNEGFTVLPATLTQIDSLQCLDLSYNAQLMLQFRDAHMLARFPVLLCVRFVQEGGMSQASMEVLNALRRMRPGLDLVLSVGGEQPMRDVVVEGYP